MKIVVGTDGSTFSERAVEWCARMAGKLDAEVIVVHSIEIPVAASGLGYLPIPPLSPETREAVREVLAEKWCLALAAANVPYRTVLTDGNAATALAEVARDEDADLVVTGRRGLGGFAELLVGSTSHQLSHHLDRPLVIVP